MNDLRTGDVTPGQGGCWYCYEDDGTADFSREFDTSIHIRCLKHHISNVLEKHDPEADVFFRELLWK